MKRLLLLSSLFSILTIASKAQELPCYEAGLVNVGVACSGTQTVIGCDCVTYANACEAAYHNGITHFSTDNTGCGGIFPCHADFFYSNLAGVFSAGDSSQTSGFMTGYSYDFGDGSFSTDPNPSHTFSTSGYYIVCLTIVDTPASCTSTTCRVVLAQGAACNAMFSDTTICGVTTLTDISTGSGYTANWTFDGTNVLGQAPGSSVTHTFPGPGTYPVTLVITDGGTGTCNSTITSNITVTVPSVAAGFSYSSTGTPNNVVTFTNTSSGASTYHWDFGDGDTSIASSPVHDYPASPCSNDIELIATDANGCSSTLQMTIDVCSVGIFSTPSVLNSITVYPNPAKDDVTVLLNSSITSNVILTLKDVTGRIMIDAVPIHLHAGENSYKLDLPQLGAGVYLIQVSNETGMMNKSVLVR